MLVSIEVLGGFDDVKKVIPFGVKTTIKSYGKNTIIEYNNIDVCSLSCENAEHKIKRYLKQNGFKIKK